MKIRRTISKGSQYLRERMVSVVLTNLEQIDSLAHAPALRLVVLEERPGRVQALVLLSRSLRNVDLVPLPPQEEEAAARHAHAEHDHHDPRVPASDTREEQVGVKEARRKACGPSHVIHSS